MFDMIRVAQKIREARIANNMTQMHLAEEIGVSYQAVSSWERGNSMPDIAKLEQLCNILNISVDELLGTNTSGQAVKKAMSMENGKNAIASPLSLKELQDIAPLLPPREIENMAEQTVASTKLRDLSEIAGLAPFLSGETLDKLAMNVQVTDLCSVATIAPFLSGQTLDRLVQDVKTDDLCQVAGLAPFLSRETLDNLVQDIKTDDLCQIVGLAPFLSRQTLDKLVQDVKTDDLCQITGLAPFLSQETLDNLITKGLL